MTDLALLDEAVRRRAPREGWLFWRPADLAWMKTVRAEYARLRRERDWFENVRV